MFMLICCEKNIVRSLKNTVEVVLSEQEGVWIHYVIIGNWLAHI